MKLKNPTQTEIRVQVLGREYSVGPGEVITVSEEVGLYWKNRIHTFMEVVTEESPRDLPKEETKEEPKEEVKEEIVEKKEVKTKSKKTKVK